MAPGQYHDHINRERGGLGGKAGGTIQGIEDKKPEAQDTSCSVVGNCQVALAMGLGELRSDMLTCFQ